jgi:hypothetical protein
MAQVQKVELEVKRQSSNIKGTAEVIVRSTLSFAAEEIGKDFKLRIALYGSDPEEPKEADVENDSKHPVYVFQFSNPPMILPKRDYTIIHAISGTIIHEETRLIPVAFFNEDADLKQSHYLILPIPDSIYAVVNLSIEKHSNTIQLLYAPVGNLARVEPKPHIRIHVL